MTGGAAATRLARTHAAAAALCARGWPKRRGWLDDASASRHRPAAGIDADGVTHLG
jgi:hypothetical protein